MAFVRDLKPGAMFLFKRAQAAKGKNREGGPGRNFRQEIYVGQVYFREKANCLAFVRDLKTAALCEFERSEKRAWRGGAASGEGQRADLWPRAFPDIFSRGAHKLTRRVRGLSSYFFIYLSLETAAALLAVASITREIICAKSLCVNTSMPAAVQPPGVLTFCASAAGEIPSRCTI